MANLKFNDGDLKMIAMHSIQSVLTSKASLAGLFVVEILKLVFDRINLLGRDSALKILSQQAFSIPKIFFLDHLVILNIGRRRDSS